MKKLAFLFSATLVLSASAVDYRWLGTVDSNWQNPANWDTAGNYPGMPAWNVNMYTNRIFIRNRPAGGQPLEYTAREGETWIDAFKIDDGDFIVNGGKLVLTNTSDTVSSVGSSNTGTGGGAWIVNGGHIVFSTHEAIYISQNSPADVEFTINGGEINFYRFELRGQRSTTTTSVNFNGGVVSISQPLEQFATRPFKNYVNFNGTTVKAGNWMYSSSATSNYALTGSPLQIRDGGAKIETTLSFSTASISSGIQHSDIVGDNPVDGGLIHISKATSSYLNLMGTNTFTGATVSSNGFLRLSDTSSHAFYIKSDGSVNGIHIVTGASQFQGVFNIVPGAKPFVFASWPLVASAVPPQYALTFGLEINGVPFKNNGNGTYTLRDYQYDTATGILTRAPLSTLFLVK